jgi:hypothetical protein
VVAVRSLLLRSRFLRLGSLRGCPARLCLALVYSFLVCPGSAWASDLASVAETPQIHIQSGQADAVAPRAIHHNLARQWPRYAGWKNLDRAGLFQLALGVLGRPPWFPYFAGFAQSERLRFVNFGHAGFFLGMTQEPSPSSNSGSAGAVSAGARGFEPLIWGVTYLAPSITAQPGFLRDEYLFGSEPAVGPLRQWQKVNETLEDHPIDVLRQAHIVLWSGGSLCLAAGLNPVGGTEVPPWMRCDAPFTKRLSALKSGVPQHDAKLFFGQGAEGTRSEAMCGAVGLLRDTGIEGFGVTKGSRSRCVFVRSPFEDRWGVRSKVHCHDPQSSSHLWGNFDQVDFVFPLLSESASSQRFYLVEGRFQPPRLTEIDLAGRASRALSAKGEAGWVPSGSQVRGRIPSFVPLPRGDFGLYQCLDDDGQRGLGRSLYFVDGAVFRGERVVEPDVEQVYEYKALADRALASRLASRLVTWKAIMDERPALDRFPDLGCVYQPAIDVKCGVRVLQTVAQLDWEEQQGLLTKVLSPEIRTSVQKLRAHLLGRVQSQLPSWGLSAEVRRLASTPKKAASSHEQPQENNPWLRYLSLPE